MNKYVKFGIKIICIIMGLFIVFHLVGYLYALITPKFDIRSANSFYLYDNSKALVMHGNTNNEWVNLDEMGDYIVNATISVEDKNFYSHAGFDFLRITKAMMMNIQSKEIVQGASTITQQYARNLFSDFSTSWKRKWKEMWLTFELETHYSKDEILEGYLNTINYGHGIYGIANASKFYFNKEVKNLSLAETAILAGIPNSPSNFSPIDNYNDSKERQKIVLDRMYHNGYISKRDKDKAESEKLAFYGKDEKEKLSSLMYFYDAVQNELNSISSIPKSYLETGGLKIYTTLDMKAQEALDISVKDNMIDDDVQNSKVMINPKNGEVMGVIGGVNYGSSQYNRAIHAVRQPGSTVKPFLYYAALNNNFTASSKFLSEKTTFNFENGEPYSPQNASNIYANKEISLAAAIAYSDNIYAIKTHLFLGEQVLVNTLKDAGMTSKLEESVSLPLGTYEISTLELASMYQVLANSGVKHDMHFINRVEDIHGNVLYEYKEKGLQIFDPSLTFIISELLTGSYDPNLINYTYPTCINLVSKLTHKYAIKSGSTDTDAWIVGYLPDALLVSWAGYDDNRKISNEVTSSNKVAWSSAMEGYLKDKKVAWYDTPPNVVGVLVDPISGDIATKSSKNKKVLYYIAGTQPSY